LLFRGRIETSRFFASKGKKTNFNFAWFCFEALNPAKPNQRHFAPDLVPDLAFHFDDEFTWKNTFLSSSQAVPEVELCHFSTYFLLSRGQRHRAIHNILLFCDKVSVLSMSY